MRRENIVEEEKNVYMILAKKPEDKTPVERPRHRWEDNIKSDIRTILWVYGLDLYGSE
jgi:hypothetical protein